MKWILILILSTGYGSSVDHVEFDNLRACAKAFKDVKKRSAENLRSGELSMVCVPKQVEKSND